MTEWYTLPGFNQPMSSMSHLIGALVYLVLSFFLLRRAWRTRATFWNASLFAFAAVTLLSLSGVYHMFSPSGKAGRVMIRLDVAAIFFMIASTFTPIHGLLFSGWKRWGILIPLWTIAITGITLRTIFFSNIPLIVGTGIFLLMGWIGGWSAFLLAKQYGRRALYPTIMGGVMYTIGAVGDALSWPTIIPLVWGSHETFHFFVLAGLGFHWSFVADIVDGKFKSGSEEIEAGKNCSESIEAEKDGHSLTAAHA
ncbi:MAG: hemolysin III family protein [Planctomycetota bacterium]